VDLLCCDCGGDHITLGSAWVALAGVWGSGPFSGFQCSYTKVFISNSIEFQLIMLNHAFYKTRSVKAMMPTAQSKPQLATGRKSTHIFSYWTCRKRIETEIPRLLHQHKKTIISKTTSLQTQSSPPHPFSASSSVPILPVGVSVGTASHAANRSFLAMIGSASVGCGIAIVSRAVICSLHT